MIATVFVPDGIVISTWDIDRFLHRDNSNEESPVQTLVMKGLPHYVDFWGKYILMFHQTAEYYYDSEIRSKLQKVAEHERWGKGIPQIHEVMPYIKKQIMDEGLNLIGVMAGYSDNGKGKEDPYVYQILGSDIRRVNAGSDGRPFSNCMFFEKEVLMGRLLRGVKVSNGDEWEELSPMQIRCDLFSLRKACETSRFLIRTFAGLQNINGSFPAYKIETVKITPEKIEIDTTEENA